MKAWHFVGDTLRDGRPVPQDGELLHHDGDIKMCASGLHASKRLIDALRYAPGNTICRVKVGGPFKIGNDKLVATERTILWRIDGETVLRRFTKRQALNVAHLWQPPQIVMDYLKSDREELRAAAWSAAETAAWSAAGAAAEAAAGAAANKQLTAMVNAAHKVASK